MLGASGFPGSRHSTFTPVVSRVFFFLIFFFLKAFPGRDFFVVVVVILLFFAKGGVFGLCYIPKAFVRRLRFFLCVSYP